MHCFYDTLRAIFLFVCFSFLFSCEERNPAGPDSSDDLIRHEESLHFKGVRTFLSRPSQVQFLFSLRDRNDRAITRSASKLAGATRIFENGEGLDTLETGFFLHDFAGIPLDLVLVLDFTSSMASWSEDGENAIAAMSAGVRSLLDSLGRAHRVALIEYHDRNVSPAVLSYFNSDKRAVRAAFDGFLNSSFDAGASRCWDALYTGLALFPEVPDSQQVRMMILLSDGHDTSSERKLNEIATLAKKKNVQIHTIGSGPADNQNDLEFLAYETEGSYYAASNLAALRQQLRTVARDLWGHYRLGYVTLKSSGEYAVRVEITWENAVNYFEKKLNLGQIYADDRTGRITYDETGVQEGRAEVYFRAGHVPREINRFRFRLGPQKPSRFELVKRSEGGLCEGWRLNVPDSLGFYDLRAPAATALDLGAFGILFKACFENLTESGLILTCEFDNSIYPGGKSFSFPETVYVGMPIFDPQPANGALQNAASPITVSWKIQNPRQLPMTFDVMLDSLDANQLLAEKLTSTGFLIPRKLAPNTRYYWRVIAHSAHRRFPGPKWSFQTY